MKLREIGEDRLLGRLLPDLPLAKAVVRGPGDDCAVVETRDRQNFLVLKTDCVVAGVHFLATANAVDVGWKAMMRPLSDFAATSAVPQFALITLIAPQQTTVEWVEELYRGVHRAAKRFKASLVRLTVQTNDLPLTHGAKVDDAISECEDYELLFAISPRERTRLQLEWRKKFRKLPLTRIGSLSQLSTFNSQPLPRGYVHFQ